MSSEASNRISRRNATIATTANLRMPSQYDQADTGLVESDPGRWRASVYMYLDEGGAPVAAIGPRIAWRGTYFIGSGGVSELGAGVDLSKENFAPISDCINHEPGVVSVDVLSSRLGWRTGFLGPLSNGSSTVAFEDIHF